jgi:hypothetical protein
VALFTAAGNVEIQQAKEVSRGRCGRRAPGRRRALDLMLGQSGDVVEWRGGSGLGLAMAEVRRKRSGASTGRPHSRQR